MIVMVLFLLNMLLAIIMDAYQMEKYKASDATTLWQQILDMLQRRRQYMRGERVRLTDVWNTFRWHMALMVLSSTLGERLHLDLCSVLFEFL